MHVALYFQLSCTELVNGSESATEHIHLDARIDLQEVVCSRLVEHELDRACVAVAHMLCKLDGICQDL